MWSLALAIIVPLSIHFYFRILAHGYLYDDVERIPPRKVGLLPGTSQKLRNGRPNLFLKYRIDAARQLFQHGKIQYILVSGDNATRYYNEPATIKDMLIDVGIPENRIVLDFAGFRTLDSVIRAREVFDLHSFTIISQKFHNERALYIARYYNIDAIAFNAKDVSMKAGIRTHTREVLARMLALVDLHVIHREPRFLGEKIPVEKKASEPGGKKSRKK